LRKTILVLMILISFFALSMSAWSKTLTLNPSQTKALADIIKERDQCKADLHIKTETLGHCWSSLSVPQEPIEWYQEPEFIVGGYAISFGLGALFVASKCLGACR